MVEIERRACRVQLAIDDRCYDVINVTTTEASRVLIDKYRLSTNTMDILLRYFVLTDGHENLITQIRQMRETMAISQRKYLAELKRQIL